MTLTLTLALTLTRTLPITLALPLTLALTSAPIMTIWGTIMAKLPCIMFIITEGSFIMAIGSGAAW